MSQRDSTTQRLQTFSECDAGEVERFVRDKLKKQDLCVTFKCDILGIRLRCLVKT